MAGTLFRQLMLSLAIMEVSAPGTRKLAVRLGQVLEQGLHNWEICWLEKLLY